MRVFGSKRGVGAAQGARRQFLVRRGRAHRSRAPRAVAYRVTVNGNFLAVQADPSRDVHRLVEMAGRPKRPRTDGVGVGRNDPLMDEVRLKTAGVAVDGAVFHQWFDRLEADSVREGAMAEIAPLGERQPLMPTLVKSALGRIVPNPRPPVARLLHRKYLGIEPAAQIAFGNVERPPVRLGLPPMW